MPWLGCRWLVADTAGGMTTEGGGGSLVTLGGGAGSRVGAGMGGRGAMATVSF